MVVSSCASAAPQPCRGECGERGQTAAASAPEPAAPAPDPRFATDRRGPATLDDLLDATHFQGRGHLREWRAAVEPLVGQLVEWNLLSWGGEITSREGGYETPDARHGRVRSVVRLVVPQARDLEAVDTLGSAVVECPAIEDAEEGKMIFMRADGSPGDVDTPGVVRVQGRIWGARGEGGLAILWLSDCKELL